MSPNKSRMPEESCKQAKESVTDNPPEPPGGQDAPMKAQGAIIKN